MREETDGSELRSGQLVERERMTTRLTDEEYAAYPQFLDGVYANLLIRFAATGR